MQVRPRPTDWERLDLPLRGEGEAACPATGQRYRLSQDRVELLES